MVMNDLMIIIVGGESFRCYLRLVRRRRFST